MVQLGDVERGKDPHYSQEKIQEYQQRYHKGLDLFQKAFKDYTRPNLETHQKAQFRKVMVESLQIMNETASVALKQGKLADGQRLNEDYEQFMKNPKPENQQKISDDIDSLQQ